ncbi:hypothetical protein DFA_05042 [Cavenderia fasciculata]|uniref:Uncharacterized protein n=1 Tax=Cavenderia fasciculata TaxID=261658 RepID=F4PN19_CACFS|nr:uncharacterized protein DFA_05042 [Cavenderia fasciculata]EGG22912.1 hypothetical protein DFA_05042 [Cavenderia fasciculata]|eukprot:XP_004360763.1 hypothetical protein DFA_05042 [Cavenderia fasciculata]
MQWLLRSGYYHLLGDLLARGTHLSWTQNDDHLLPMHLKVTVEEEDINNQNNNQNQNNQNNNNNNNNNLELIKLIVGMMHKWAIKSKNYERIRDMLGWSLKHDNFTWYKLIQTSLNQDEQYVSKYGKGYGLETIQLSLGAKHIPTKSCIPLWKWAKENNEIPKGFRFTFDETISALLCDDEQVHQLFAPHYPVVVPPEVYCLSLDCFQVTTKDCPQSVISGTIFDKCLDRYLGHAGGTTFVKFLLFQKIGLAAFKAEYSVIINELKGYGIQQQQQTSSSSTSEEDYNNSIGYLVFKRLKPYTPAGFYGYKLLTWIYEVLVASGKAQLVELAYQVELKGGDTIILKDIAAKVFGMGSLEQIKYVMDQYNVVELYHISGSVQHPILRLKATHNRSSIDTDKWCWDMATLPIESIETILWDATQNKKERPLLWRGLFYSLLLQDKSKEARILLDKCSKIISGPGDCRDQLKVFPHSMIRNYQLVEKHIKPPEPGSSHAHIVPRLEIASAIITNDLNHLNHIISQPSFNKEYIVTNHLDLAIRCEALDIIEWLFVKGFIKPNYSILCIWESVAKIGSVILFETLVRCIKTIHSSTNGEESDLDNIIDYVNVMQTNLFHGTFKLAQHINITYNCLHLENYESLTIDDLILYFLDHQ